MVDDDDTPKKGDYEVGYGKPPKATQFQKGQSGNPKGRAKGAKGLRTILTEVVHAKQTIQINKEPVTKSRLELTFLTQAIRAAAGDGKSADRLIPLVIQLLGVEDAGHKRDALSPYDQALMDELFPEDAGFDASSSPEDPNQAEPAPDEAADENLSGSEEEGGQDADVTP